MTLLLFLCIIALALAFSWEVRENRKVHCRMHEEMGALLAAVGHLINYSRSIAPQEI